MMGVPANYLFMAAERRFGDADLSSLRQVIVGGAPMPQRLLRTQGEGGVPEVRKPLSSQRSERGQDCGGRAGAPAVGDPCGSKHVRREHGYGYSRT